MNIKLATTCAALCSWARQPQNDKTVSEIERFGYTDVRFFDDDGTQCFMARNDDHIIVAFRGTELSDKNDIIYDGMIWPKRGMKQGWVHAGFAKACDQVWSSVQQTLDIWVEEYDMADKVIFTGHSLGGAIAVVCAARSKYVADVYTYGQPRVGNKKYTKNVKSRIYRFTHENDLVPRVPPGPFYLHQGQEYHLFPNKVTVVKNSVHSALLWYKAAFRQIIRFRLFTSFFKDHKIVRYWEALRKLD